jgi:hypothetical protein
VLEAQVPLCPLCGGVRAAELCSVHGKDYLECADCRLIFLQPEQRLDAKAERAHYLSHENDPRDLRYRAFLGRLAQPLVERLKAGAEGLDYGAGPGPTLSVMLEEQGFRVALYDPFFAPDEAVLCRTYDFITCTEVAEHFYAPGEELLRLDRLLRPRAWLGLMTEWVPEARDFADWYYVRDPTHVCFYRAETLDWIANRFGWFVESPQRNVVLFRKGGDQKFEGESCEPRSRE